MNDQEPLDGDARYIGGSAVGDEQTYSSAQPPYGSSEPASEVPYFTLPQQPTPTYPPPPGAGYLPPQAPFGMPDIVGTEPPAQKRRLATIVTSVVAVLAIILGAGGFTAYKLLASSGGQPDKWAPANSIAFAKADLDPSASAKVAAWEFEQKFPGAPKVGSADQLKDALLKSGFDSDGTHQVNYDTDVKPWLGDRVAFAVFLDSAGKPQPIAILQVKDAGKAKAGLAKLNSSGGSAYSVQGEYVVVGQTQAIVDEAVAAARKANISTNRTYASDIAALKTDRIVTAWWDAGATIKALAPDLPGTARGLLMSGSMTGLPDATKVGRFVMGLRVQPSYVEVEGRILGGSSSLQLANGNAGEALGNLPVGTVAGLGLANPEQIVKTELQSLKSGMLGANLQKQLDAVGAQLGISLPGDLENLLGSELGFGVETLPVHGAMTPDSTFSLVTHPDDLAKGLQTAKTLVGAESLQGSMQLYAMADGSTVRITNDSHSSAGTRRLSDDAAFKAAMAGMPKQAVLAGYVDLGKIVAAEHRVTADSKHLESLGFYVGVDSSSPVFDVKLTVK